MKVKRDQLSEEQLKEALDHCANEPIHIPGSIQPHGMLVVVDSNLKIEQISANAHHFLGVHAEECLGKKLSEFVDLASLHQLQAAKSGQALQPIQSVSVTIGDKQYDAVSHESDGSMLVEFEPVTKEALPATFYYDQLRNFAIGMHKAKTLDEIFDHIVISIRAITGLDRVKLYRFDSDWHGEVVAEDRADFMPSYKGLHFPSSDIPEQARKLYTQNYLRLIADINYKPVMVLPEQRPGSNAPLDMSLSMLRSVSPIHIQYLANINVQASMSVSIIQNNELWGLIACHHNSPLHVPYTARNVCEIMGHIFSAQLSTMENYAKREEQEKRDLLVRKLSSSLDHNIRIDHLMEESHQLASDALGADGLIVKTFVHILQYGDVPPAETVSRLIEWLNRREDNSVFHVDDAQSFFKNTPILDSLTGGVLAVPISLKSHDYIIWFRNAIIKEVVWAGDPEKPLEQTKAGYRLTPRSSFDLWKQQVSHRSEPWSQEDIKTSRSVVSVLLESEKLSAEQANIAKTEFLANMSHEIRTPMNAVIGLAKILSNSSPLTERQKEYIRTLQMSADALLALINDLLDISKIESRNLELETIPFSLTKLVQEVISMMSVKTREKGIDFTLDEEAVEGRVFIGDPGRIRQIILNLCSNAVKFTERGSIDLSIVCSPTAEPKLEKICIIVRDTGIGIAPEKLETIFHKFVQADNTISRKYGGTGLGLAITKMLTEAMGGEITVKSEPGKGSEFVVCFYLEKANEEKKEKNQFDSGNASLVSDGPLVLLVEDYEANILVATSLLESYGYRYEVATSGVEAVGKAKSQRYAAIIMDVQMPGMNGFEATQLIREFEKAAGTPPTPIIGMTAHALAGDRERCLAAGMDDYIAKPVNEAELKGKLQAYTAVQSRENV